MVGFTRTRSSSAASESEWRGPQAGSWVWCSRREQRLCRRGRLLGAERLRAVPPDVQLGLRGLCEVGRDCGATTATLVNTCTPPCQPSPPRGHPSFCFFFLCLFWCQAVFRLGSQKGGCVQGNVLKYAFAFCLVPWVPGNTPPHTHFPLPCCPPGPCLGSAGSRSAEARFPPGE